MLSRFLHIILALNLLVSSTGVAVYEHICSKKGTTLGFFQKPENCCHKTKVKSCCLKSKAKTCSIPIDTNASQPTFNKKPCCEDKSHFNKLNISATAYDKIVLEYVQNIFSFSEQRSIIELLELPTSNEKTLSFRLYKPPSLYTENIRVLYQSFLC